MAFVKKKDSLQTTLTDSRKIFVGRINELDFFVRNILRPIEPSHNIISISGQAGVGKSTLLMRFIDEARATDFKDYCLIGIVDEQQSTPINIMEKFADQLHISGQFEKALKQYKEALRKLQAESEIFQDAIWESAPDFAGAVVEGVPMVGPILREGAKTATVYLLNKYYTAERQRDAKRLENPISELTRAFVAELNRLTETQVRISSSREKRQQRVILCFDTFEMLASEVAPWLLDYFLETDISLNVVLVIAGRDRIEHSTPEDPKRWLPYYDSETIYTISLDGFTQDEVYTYLTERGITNPTQVAKFWNLSRGLPLYLGLLTSEPHGKVDPTANVVANFLRWIPEEQQVKRRLALDAALFSKSFNQDDLEAFTYLSRREDEQVSIYHWLISLPFVIPQEGRYRYHDQARELFSHHLYQGSKKRYYATRRTIADHYSRLLEGIQLEAFKKPSRDLERSELIAALAYQLFLIPDKTKRNKAIGYVLDTYEHTDQINEIARTLHELSQESVKNLVPPESRLIIESLLYYIESDPLTQAFLTAANNILNEVANEPSFSSDLLARIYLRRGQVYFGFEKFQLAIEDFDRVIDLNPNVARAYDVRNLMYLLQLRKEYDLVIEDFTRSLEMEPEDIDTSIRRGLAYLSLQEYNRALVDFDRVLASRANIAWVYVHRGLSHIGRQGYDRAIEDFNQALALEPKDSWTYIRLGQAYLSRQEYDHAIKNFNQALALEPKDIQAYIHRGQTYISLQEYGRAIEDFNQALALEPKDIQAYIHRGQAYISLQEYDRAIEDFDRALNIEPENAQAYASRGLASLWLEDIEQARDNYARSWELSHVNFNVGLLIEWCKMCLLSAEPQDTENLEIIVAVDPQHYAAYICRGIVLWHLHSFEKALSELNRAITAETEKWEAYFWRGMVYAYLEENEAALSSLERSLMNGLPPVLLSPLRWLERERPDFFRKYAKSLLARY